ncbi:hypothetical protein B566_EDAN004488 [Ephemera danica]|nr:hypothetical protein B566_EDAN004488 [Ephemera danica]
MKCGFVIVTTKRLLLGDRRMSLTTVILLFRMYVVLVPAWLNTGCGLHLTYDGPGVEDDVGFNKCTGELQRADMQATPSVQTQNIAHQALPVQITPPVQTQQAVQAALLSVQADPPVPTAPQHPVTLGIYLVIAEKKAAKDAATARTTSPVATVTEQASRNSTQHHDQIQQPTARRALVSTFEANQQQENCSNRSSNAITDIVDTSMNLESRDNNFLIASTSASSSFARPCQPSGSNFSFSPFKNSFGALLSGSSSVGTFRKVLLEPLHVYGGFGLKARQTINSNCMRLIQNSSQASGVGRPPFSTLSVGSCPTTIAGGCTGAGSGIVLLTLLDEFLRIPREWVFAATARALLQQQPVPLSWRCNAPANTSADHCPYRAIVAEPDLGVDGRPICLDIEWSIFGFPHDPPRPLATTFPPTPFYLFGANSSFWLLLLSSQYPGGADVSAVGLVVAVLRESRRWRQRICNPPVQQVRLVAQPLPNNLVIKPKGLTPPACTRTTRGLRADYIDGEVYKQKYHSDDSAIYIFLYRDDLEICNPLGSAKIKHKISATYFTLGAHKIGCFLQSFWAEYFCRFCPIRREEFKNNPTKIKQFRTPTQYEKSAKKTLKLTTN